jgi:polyisoprenoid-binding protein YceI
MKTNKFFKSMFALFAILTVIGVRAAASDTYTLDPVHSWAMFKVRHLGIGYVWGSFTGISGTITYDKKNVKNNKVEITIKTASVNTFNDTRDADLRSDNFFNVEKFPDMTFKSRSVSKLKDGRYSLKGDFTLLGVTKPITITAAILGEGKDPWGNHRAGFDSSFSINRSDYGMNKMIPAAGDKVLITLNFEGIYK